MEKKILVAVDDSMPCRACVKYIGELSAIISNLHMTLCHIQPGVSQFLITEAKTDARARTELNKILRKNETAAKDMLAGIRDRLKADGFDPERIETLTRPKDLGLAKDIIELAQEGRYDAIAAGRRGLSGLQEMFLGSLTSKLAEHSAVIPVWIISGKVPNTRILLAVDGSESAYRAVDHVSFMLDGNTDVTVTLFHALPNMRDYCEIDFSDTNKDIEEFMVEDDKRCLNRFYAHALKRFKESGIDEKQIEVKEAGKKGNVGKAIVQEAKNGDYGTVVVGRQGLGRSFFMGRISKYVLSQADNRAVWMVS
ncbi:hypothetical protein D3OALGA1CA_5476 [Olavius algarvensis associated proteobacterium Delta 3]|nr:hypothetical protein D3OALGB2SA_1321 [Olavius algarvensis associated proteobacterium Delta 3]CAB5167440.1 hypothetical protein D3OALGA1CA_5476 [Olavius algarvensis associated proteobacterium Delta 3]